MTIQIKKLSARPKHHFFGYYGINPWNEDLRYHLALETNFHQHRPKADDIATIGLIDCQTNRFISYAQTTAFNLQQGSMLHWIKLYDEEVFSYNDWQDQKLVSRLVNPRTKKTRTIPGAIAALHPNQAIAIGLNYARMAWCRAVVGYANDIPSTHWSAHPKDDGLHRLNLITGQATLLLSINEVIKASGLEIVSNQPAWFNHVVFNSNGERFFFFCRVKTEGKWLSSLWTVNIDGSDLACQIPFGAWISHGDWQDESHIIISTDYLGPRQFCHFTDGQNNFKPFLPTILPEDGHACFSPDGQWLICDTYPNNPARLAKLLLYHFPSERKFMIGEFYAAPQFTGDIRCDLHPRWAKDSKTITFDSVHEGHRQIYQIILDDKIFN